MWEGYTLGNSPESRPKFHLRLKPVPSGLAEIVLVLLSCRDAGSCVQSNAAADSYSIREHAFVHGHEKPRTERRGPRLGDPRWQSGCDGAALRPLFIGCLRGG